MRMAAMATPTNSKYSWMWQMELDVEVVEVVGVGVGDTASARYPPLMQLMSAEHVSKSVEGMFSCSLL